MRILWVATKAPSPITDGGRAVMLATIEALAALPDVRLTVVTPLPIDTRIGEQIDEPIKKSTEDKTKSVENPTIVRSVHQNVCLLRTDSYFLEWPNAIIRSFRSGRPASVERHAHAPLAALVERLIRDEPPFDVVHSEQLQALPIAEPARRAGVACVLRAQNVESAVWETTANEAPAWRATPMRLEARRMRRFEAAEVCNVDATIALSAEDAAALAALCPEASARIIAVPPPIPSEWCVTSDRSIGSNGSNDAGDDGSNARSNARRDGGPAFIWIGSAGWAPNDGARDWLLADIWPAIAARVPGAQLHVFGSDARESGGSIVWRGAARESAEAFMAGGIVLIPMRTASGVRMRVLEAWARGIPVIASPAALSGLDAEDGRDVLLAADARAFAEAAARLSGDASLRARLVAGGRATLASRHDSKRIAEATLDVYRLAIERRRARQGAGR